MLTQQLDHDRRMRNIDRLHDLIVQGSKNLAILNGGAVIAMLAFVQALVEKPAYQSFKLYALGALSCFLIGAFLAAITFFFHHGYINRAYQDPDAQMKWKNMVWIILFASSIFTLTGGALVAIGIWLAVILISVVYIFLRGCEHEYTQKNTVNAT